VEEFMASGKARMLKTKREMFMRQKSGYLVPVYTYLFINHVSRNHMVLLFEKNEQFFVFEEPYHDAAFAFIVANKDY
jgi:hypothetical protein